MLRAIEGSWDRAFGCRFSLLRAHAFAICRDFSVGPLFDFLRDRDLALLATLPGGAINFFIVALIHHALIQAKTSSPQSKALIAMTTAISMLMMMAPALPLWGLSQQAFL